MKSLDHESQIHLVHHQLRRHSILLPVSYRISNNKSNDYFLMSCIRNTAVLICQDVELLNGVYAPFISLSLQLVLWVLTKKTASCSVTTLIW